MHKIKGLITHEKPHFDEFVALWLLSKFGNDIFENIEGMIREGKIEFLRDNFPPDTDNYIFLGVSPEKGGKFVFDEHPSSSKKRDEGETCASLVAKFLRIDQIPEIQFILKEVANVDLRGNGGAFHISNTIKLMLENNIPFLPIQNTVFVQITLVYNSQLEFQKAGEDLAKADKFDINHNGRDVKVVIAQTENLQFSKFARSKGFDVIVQRNLKGNVQIFTRRPSQNERRDGGTDICLDDLVKVIRIVEENVRGGKICEDHQILLSEQGPEGTVWYYSKAGILNGSNTATGIEPTKIPFDKMEKLVQIGLGNTFPSDRASSCSSGNCTNNSNLCPFFLFHLSRCRAIRGEV